MIFSFFNILISISFIHLCEQRVPMVTEVCVRVLKCDPCVCVSKVQYVSLLSSSYQKNEVPRSALKVTVSWKNFGQIKQPVRSEVRAVLSASGTLPRPLLFCRAMKR